MLFICPRSARHLSFEVVKRKINPTRDMNSVDFMDPVDRAQKKKTTNKKSKKIRIEKMHELDFFFMCKLLMPVVTRLLL